MYAKTFGETVCGINGEEIIVEVDISNGLPGFDIVGLPDMAVKESRERVWANLLLTAVYARLQVFCQ